MTKRHFIELADTVKEFNRPEWDMIPFSEDQIGALADFCESQNPRFNRELWLRYVMGLCGPSGGKLKKVA